MQNTTNGSDECGFGEALRAHRTWFVAFTAAALLLRFWFVFQFPAWTPDSLVYGDFARNWLVPHVYGISSPSGPVAEDFRLPGYPAYLAIVFSIAGMDHYGAALIGQVFVDLGTCFLIAMLAWRMCGERAARWAFALAALCPFLANYASTALTETWEIFFTALALLLATYGAAALREKTESPRAWAWCGLAIGAATLFRPDGGMILIALGVWLGWQFLRSRGIEGGARRRRIALAAALLATFTFVPLLPWTVRNAVTLHEFRPLPSVTAAARGEFYPAGFERWMKTWTEDYASMEDIEFNVSGEAIPFDLVPTRAFDTPQQRQRTAELFQQYNQTKVMTPELDAQFGALARERIEAAPLRFYLGLPVMRGLDMWLRPRTEMLPVDVHWWRWADDPHDSGIAIGLGVGNLALLAMAGWSLARIGRLRYAGMWLTYIALRTILLAAIATPEPRYVLECYPVVLALAGAALAKATQKVYSGQARQG